VIELSLKTKTVPEHAVYETTVSCPCIQK